MFSKSEMDTKIRMGASRGNLQARPKILKKIIETPNLAIKTIIFQKNIFSTLKV
jgi:hypothetical protein